MVSIKEVAEAAGVSTATVSRVLSNGLHVRPEVRERVLLVVEQLGYRPNLVARSLRSQQTRTIGLLVSDIGNPFFTALSRAVEDTAYSQGFSVLLCNTDEQAEKEANYLNVMRDTNAAGVIISPTRQTAANLKNAAISFPLVVVDRSIESEDIDTVMLDNVDAAYRLTAHVIEQGYRRIGALYSEMSTGLERQMGFERALREHGLVPRSEHIRYVAPRIEAGYAATLKILDGGSEPPDALFTVNSQLAAGALQALRERKLVVPDDMALVTFDETSWTSLVQPAITLIAQPTYEIGKAAAELLLQRIAEPERPARQVMLRGKLLVRGSSAARMERAG